MPATPFNYPPISIQHLLGFRSITTTLHSRLDQMLWFAIPVLEANKLARWAPYTQSSAMSSNLIYSITMVSLFNKLPFLANGSNCLFMLQLCFSPNSLQHHASGNGRCIVGICKRGTGRMWMECFMKLCCQETAQQYENRGNYDYIIKLNIAFTLAQCCKAAGLNAGFSPRLHVYSRKIAAFDVILIPTGDCSGNVDRSR